MKTEKINGARELSKFEKAKGLMEALDSFYWDIEYRKNDILKTMKKNENGEYEEHISTVEELDNKSYAMYIAFDTIKNKVDELL